MRLPIIAAAAALARGGCASNLDKLEKTTFEPGPNGAFQMIVRDQGIDFTEDDRLGWLNEYVTDNNLCPAGYQITDRKQIVQEHALLGDILEVIYEGKCKA